MIYKLLSVLLFIPLFVACGDNNNGIDEEEESAPALVSTIPVNNATVAPQTDSVIFIFDRKITVIDKAKMKLNAVAVLNAVSSENILTVFLNPLEEKTNYTVTIEKNAIKAISGKVNPEAFSITFTTGELPPVEIAPLVAAAPSPEAVNLYNFLKENYGKKIISGTVANVSWNVNEAEWVFRHTGKYPALNAFDYIHLYASPANWINYENTQVVENWWNNNGIVSALWHWNVPVSQGSNNYSFYTEQTSFDVSKAVSEGTYENSIIKADLEKIANCLLLLKQKNIPILWRPLHEAAGQWFWWGAKGAQPCKALWKLMFETFESKGLNNLIWVWTVEPNDSEWYPGDEYVDIVGRDLYNKTGTGEMSAEYDALKKRFPNKIIALSECGDVAGIAGQWSAGAAWSWFMPWYDYERTNNPSGSAFNDEAHQHAGAAFWKNAFANDKVISRDQMPSLK
jgi:mannan endo-1,4-beta-mannosidase